MSKICIIAFHVGKLPDYFSYFISSCEHNPTIDFIVFNDTIPRIQKKNNILLVPLSLREFNSLATIKLHLPVTLKDSWKINEFKPAFGAIFDDYLTSYDFWGWCDIDVIWGNIRNFLTEGLLTSYDVIVPKEKWTAGHFTLFKNSPPFNKLFEFSPSYKSIFLSEKYTAFEESCHRWQGDFFSIDSLVKNNKLVSMFDVVKNLEHENHLRAYFKNMVREHPQAINYVYKEGSWYDLNNNNEEFMYYHLLIVKKIWRFFIPKWKQIPDKFFASPKGIFSAAQSAPLNKFLWSIQRAFFCSKGMFYSSKNQRPLALATKAFKEINKAF